MKNPMLSGYGVRPLRYAPVSKRKKSRGKRSAIKHTVTEPKWMRRGRVIVKSARRAAWNMLAWIGVIVLVIWIIQHWGGGG